VKNDLANGLRAFYQKQRLAFTHSPPAQRPH